MKTLILAATLAITAVPASAKTVVCEGTYYGMKDHVLVTQDIQNEKAPACAFSVFSQAFERSKDFCDIDSHCSFTGHVVRRDPVNHNTYIIDRITDVID